MAKRAGTRPPDPSTARAGGSGGEEIVNRGTAGGENPPTGGEPLRGHRPMKEYYFYDSDIKNLGRTGALATLLFAAASGCLGFGANALVGLSFAENIPDTVKHDWTIYKNISFAAAIIFFVIAAILTLDGYDTVEQLKGQTRHGTEAYIPRSRFKIMIGGLMLAAMLGLGIWIGAMFW